MEENQRQIDYEEEYEKAILDSYYDDSDDEHESNWLKYLIWLLEFWSGHPQGCWLSPSGKQFVMNIKPCLDKTQTRATKITIWTSPNWLWLTWT